MPHTDRKALELFVDAVDRLVASTFAKQVRKGISTGITVRNDRLVSVALQGPDQEAVDAYLLTARMFGQDNDAISFHGISERVARVAVSQALKDRFEQSRANFRIYLDGAPVVRVEGANAATNRQIFNTFLYGMYAHRTPNYLALVEQWQRAPFYPDLHAQFYLIAHEFLKAASAMAAPVREVLREPI